MALSLIATIFVKEANASTTYVGKAKVVGAIAPSTIDACMDTPLVHQTEVAFKHEGQETGSFWFVLKRTSCVMDPNV